MKQPAQLGTDVQALIARSAQRLCRMADGRFAERDYLNGLLALGGALGLAVAPIALDAALEGLRKKRPKKVAPAKIRSARRLNRGV